MSVFSDTGQWICSGLTALEPRRCDGVRAIYPRPYRYSCNSQVTVRGCFDDLHMHVVILPDQVDVSFCAPLVFGGVLFGELVEILPVINGCEGSIHDCGNGGSVRACCVAKAREGSERLLLDLVTCYE